MILSTILNHFRLKRRIRQAADDLEGSVDDPVLEAKARAFCHSGAQMHFWSRVVAELLKRESLTRPSHTPFTIRRDAMLKREKDKRDGSAA